MLILQKKVATSAKENKGWPGMTTKHKERCYKADKEEIPQNSRAKAL